MIAPETSRTERFPATGAADLTIEIDAGRVDLRLDATDAVTVEVASDVEGAPGWVQGLAGLVDAAGGLEKRFGVDLSALAGLGVRRDESPEERAARAVAETEIAWEAGALRVRSPREVALRTVPLAVVVHAPEGSAGTVRAGAAPVDVAGRPGTVEVSTTGAVSLDRTSERSRVRCGAGDVTVGRVDGALRVKGGAGDVFLDEVHAGVEVVTGSGSVTAGRVAADLAVRCGSGNVTVRDASAGDLDLSTGAGTIQVGVHAGVDASVDLRSAAGSASSDLPVNATRSTEDPSSGTVRIRGRAAAGDTRVVRA
ncbi:DUF4097 family beta strand repeat-containing protein [Actinomycetospora termitidis]|uniref:DUF4097 family beta strand repeat-containing protein n=1 Tax=Actinomycetospora termitidis TaxID=3053470 RepID=A0ABT7M6L9_9PSEU|nr:DUF4097 family beta strand repeat-containing protein [Actinomycetospora sp. Odt1-22]MDL5156323.1 DUF4097 family beta strand repeat-containing protein [Actinomycetospora sp. Odt1-22]